MRIEGKILPHLQVGAVVLGDVRTVALTENRDLLLDVFDLIFGLLQVDCLYGHNALCAIIDAFEHLSEEEMGERTFVLAGGIQESAFLRKQTFNYNHLLYIVEQKGYTPLQKNLSRCDPAWWITPLDRSDYSERRKTHTGTTI